VSLPEHGFQLRFEARNQCLRVVEVYDPTRLACRYKGALVGGTAAVTLQRVSAMFGPTFPGEVCRCARACAACLRAVAHALMLTRTRHTLMLTRTHHNSGSERGLFALHYPGLLFVFPTPTVSSAATAARIVLCAPHAASGGAHPRLDAVLAAPPPAAPPGAPPPPAALVLCIGYGLRLEGGGSLPFGSSPQDLVAALGPPSASMVKGTDAMLIHALPTQLQGAAGGSGEYFLTWFERGLDVLVDGEVRASERKRRCAF
jgi:hypothetical protein